MKKWNVPCDFGSRRGSFQVYLGSPAPGFHPLHFQAAWLRERMGGVVLEEAMAEARAMAGKGDLKPRPWW